LEGKGPEIKRPDIYVIARFLEKLWATGKPVKKTRLQMSVGLNYGTFKKYLNWLLDRGLVVITLEKDDTEYVCLTGKGLESYDVIVNWINSMIPGEL
jgi:predicted transcriptional regulator